MLGARSCGPRHWRGRISVVPGGHVSPGLIAVARSPPGGAANCAPMKHTAAATSRRVCRPLGARCTQVATRPLPDGNLILICRLSHRTLRSLLPSTATGPRASLQAADQGVFEVLVVVTQCTRRASWVHPLDVLR